MNNRRELAEKLRVLAQHRNAHELAFSKSDAPWRRICRDAATELLNGPDDRVRRAEKIILMLTADHNSGPHYVQGFNMAQEYFQDFPHD